MNKETILNVTAAGIVVAALTAEVCRGRVTKDAEDRLTDRIEYLDDRLYNNEAGDCYIQNKLYRRQFSERHSLQECRNDWTLWTGGK